MKVKCILTCLFTLMMGTAVLAQTTQKIANVAVDSVLNAMPDYKVTNKTLETYVDQFQKQIKNKQDEMQRKYDELMAERDNLIPEVIQEKERELQQLQESLQGFSLDSQQKIAAKRSELLGPLLKKVSDSIAEVAKEKGLDFVIETGAYSLEDGFIFVEKLDITADVIRKANSKPTSQN